jgi:hypothetical protein
MKSNPENPPKILRRPHYQKITNKTQKNTNNHQKSPSFPHEIQSKKSPKNHQKSSVDPQHQKITNKTPKNTNNHQKSPRRRSCFTGEDACLPEK